VLADYFQSVTSSDIFDYGFGNVRNFLSVHPFIKDQRFDWIITNPPFNLAYHFCNRADKLSIKGFAMLTRTSFLEGIDRYDGSTCRGDGIGLFKLNPPSDILQFSERVPMHKGRLLANGSTATSYCWLIWMKGREGTKFHWIPPCRKQLERKEDYQDWRTIINDAKETISQHP
jgi:hypothetical protein